jgi:multiple sugar transport system substrate-binding protein
MKKLITALFVLALIGSGPAFAAGEAEQAASAQVEGFDWRNHEGEEIRFLALKFYYTNLIKEKLPEFEELTGIKVRLEDFPEDQFRQKMVVELAGGSTTIDAFATGTNFEGRKFYSSGWYEYLDPYLADPNKTGPDFDPDDFIRSVWDAQVFEGNRVAIPLNAVTWLLFYRKDVYEQAGLEVPQTMDDLVANAAKVHGDNIYGFAGRGMKTQSVAEFGPFLYAYGGEWIDSQRRPAFNSPAGVKALQTYVQLMQNYANPGAAENHWYDELALMQQGETAHIVDTAAWLGVLSNPEKSTVVDKVGFAHVPTVPGQEAKANLWSWNMAISSLSKKKDPAWLFIQWVTGKDMQLFIQAKNFPTARQSAWNSPEFAAVSNQEWLDAVLASFAHATPMGHPEVVEVQQIEDVIGTAIVDAILGNKQPQAALDGAAEEVAEIMARTE